MDSEPEQDSVGDASPPPETEPPVSARKRRPAPKRAAVPKRDPNEPISENWQRRQHLADRMDAPRPKTGAESQINDGAVVAENYCLRVNAYVFVEPSAAAADNSFDAWDAPLPAFRLGRIAEICAADEFNDIQFVVNWVLPAKEAYVRARDRRGKVDTREVYITTQFAKIGIASVRGECVVQHEHEIRTLAKFREKASQFYFSKFYDHATRALHDIVPLTALKSRVSATKLEKLARLAEYAIVSTEVLTALQDAPKPKRLASALPESDDEAENAETAEVAERCRHEKSRWPFKFWDDTAQAWGEPPQRIERIGPDFQCTVPDWPGAPLKFYTKGRPRSRGSPPPLKWVEQGADAGPNKTDLGQKWVQESPSGYISRGGDTTSLPLSLPCPGLAEFVALCQQSYAAPLEIPKENLNFIDACCAAFTQGGGADQALPTIARLTKRALVPDLTDEDLTKFLRLMDPFQSPQWSRVYREMGNKPFLELCLFYWSQLPLKSCLSNQITHTNDLGNQRLRCIECNTDQAPEWAALPGWVFTQVGDASTEPETSGKLALCARCARLWFRYRTGWKQCSEIKPEEQNPLQIEPELLDDANAYLIEQERRAKRRQAAAEKREATNKRKVIEKEAKQAAKRLKKEIKANGGVAPLPETTGSGTPNAQELDQVDKSTETGLSTKAKALRAKTKTPDPCAKRETKSKNSKSEPKAKEPAKSEPTSTDGKTNDDDSTTEDSDATSSRVRGTKRRNVLDTQLSLDLVDEILASLDEEIEPEDQDQPKTCPVCGQEDPSMPQLTCASCLVTVHAACYGASFAVKENETWFCDCCRNSRGKLEEVLDMNYQCELCPPRSPEYASWQAGVGGNHAPDLLKPTLTKRWCHIRCAIFNPKTSFADPKQLTGIDTLNAGLTVTSESRACRVCQEHNDTPSDAQGLTPVPTIYLAEGDQLRSIAVSQSSAIPPSRMGSTVKCELCNDYFHVSCAADHQFFMGLTGNNTRGAIVCARHLRPNSEPASYGLTPFSRVNANLNLTALQLFVSKYKQCATRAMTSIMRVQEYQVREQVRLDLGTAAVQAVAVDETQALSVLRSTPKCDQCQTTHSSFWHLSAGEKKMCSWCYRGYTVSSNSIEGRSFWTPFLSKAGRFPNTERQKPPRVSQ